MASGPLRSMTGHIAAASLMQEQTLIAKG